MQQPNLINTAEPANPHRSARRFISCLCLLLSGGLAAQLLSIIVVRAASSDIQAGGMLADIITQYLAN